MSGSSKDSSDHINGEIPILIMVVSSGGIVRFSYPFQEEFGSKRHLIASFLIAINSFAQEIFSSMGVMEQINHDDFTILINSVSDLYFTYVYQGQSEGAQIRLSEFIQFLTSEDQEGGPNVDLEELNQSVAPELKLNPDLERQIRNMFGLN